jgi:hypothetical protein
LGPTGLVDNGNRAYSDSNPPATLQLTQSGGTPANAPAGEVTIYAVGGRPYYIDTTGATGRLDNTQARDFTRTGNLAVVVGTAGVSVPFPVAIEFVTATLGTAPTGATAIIDVNKNGTTIFTTQTARPTFAIGSKVATVGTPAVSTLVANDILTVDIDQIGSTVTGADLVVSVFLRRTG